MYRDKKGWMKAKVSLSLMHHITSLLVDYHKYPKAPPSRHMVVEKHNLQYTVIITYSTLVLLNKSIIKSVLKNS